RCLAPCAGKVSPDAYARVVQDVVLFLKGKNSELLDSLKEKMDEAAARLRYEEAAAYRDKIASVKTVFDKQKVISTSLEDRDVIGYHRENDCVMAQTLIIRGGKMVGEKSFKMKSRNEMIDNEIIASFLKQYYADEVMLPKEILIPHGFEDLDLVADWLSGKKGVRVHIEVPLRGKKRRLVAMAEKNALLAMKNEIDGEGERMRALEELAETLGLKSLPQTIEGFDLSNISGAYAVGSMVYFSDGKADRSKYRRYKIRGVQGIDDYKMLREVMARRYARLIQEGEPLPDMILIDGGKGHLSKGRQVLIDLGLEDKIDLVCIAKGKHRNDLSTDEVFSVLRKTPAVFKKNSAARTLLQRIRDEAHRFAIAYHRKLRGKKSLTSPLEALPGIGKKRRLLLLKKFGGLDNIRQASLNDLTSLPGITDSLARKILETV
ncbi:MAG: excinuclease ABC subunit UvrC, partial [Nitrospinales bacterium]